MNNQNQFDASKLEEPKDGPRLKVRSIGERSLSAISLICFCWLLMWTALLIYDILLKCLPHLIATLGKSDPLSKVILCLLLRPQSSSCYFSCLTCWKSTRRIIYVQIQPSPLVISNLFIVLFL